MFPVWTQGTQVALQSIVLATVYIFSLSETASVSFAVDYQQLYVMITNNAMAARIN